MFYTLQYTSVCVCCVHCAVCSGGASRVFALKRLGRGLHQRRRPPHPGPVLRRATACWQCQSLHDGRRTPRTARAVRRPARRCRRRARPRAHPRAPPARRRQHATAARCKSTLCLLLSYICNICMYVYKHTLLLFHVLKVLL